MGSVRFEMPAGRRARLATPRLRLLLLAVLSTVGCMGGMPDENGEVATVSQDLTLRTNYALNKPTTQSSTAFGGLSSRAVDGNVDGAWGDSSVTHTDYNANAWWQVDLKQIRLVGTINVFGRTDPCCTSRLTDFWIFGSNAPFASTDLSATMNDSNVPFKAHITGQAALPVESVNPAQLLRYVRVQLSGTNWLSLAEVQVLDRPETIPGPDRIAVQTDPVATGVVTSSSGIAMTDASDSLRTYVRGADSTLAESVDFAGSLPVPYSPPLSNDPIAVAGDRYGNGHTFVAVRDIVGYLWVGERDPAANRWTWTWIRQTDLAPSVAVGCGSVYVSTVVGQQVTVVKRSLAGGSWSVAGTPGYSRATATLASSPGGDVGVAFVGTDSWIRVARASCSGDGSFGPAIAPGGTSSGTSIGLGSYGNLFGVAVQGMDNRPYFAMQQFDSSGNPQWTGFEAVEAVDDATTIIEAPTVVVFRGLIFMAARDSGKSLRSWVRNPNLLTRQSQVPWLWVAQNIIALGPYATPPAFALRGTRTLNDNYGFVERADAERYIAAKKESDQQVYSFNFGRAATKYVLGRTYRIAFNTALEANDVGPVVLPNYFDLFATFLSMPSKYWAPFSLPTDCNSTLAVTILPSTNYATGHNFPGCGTTTFPDGRSFQSPAVMIDTVTYPPWTMWEEFGHELQNAVSGFKSNSGYVSDFGAAKLFPKLCSAASDCGPGGNCAVGCTSAGCPSGAESYSSTKVCQNPGTGQGHIRPQGFVDWYDTTQDEHSFLDFVEWYRWWGDELRAMRDLDSEQGNPLLRQKYDWVKANYYDGVEFRGSRVAASGSNRNSGTYGMPLN